MTRITSRKMGQWWRRNFHSWDYFFLFFAVHWVCFQTDIIQGLVGILRWGLWLLWQHSTQTRARKWMWQITQCHPLGETVKLRVRYVWADIEFYFYCRERVVSFFLSHLSLLSSPLVPFVILPHSISHKRDLPIFFLLFFFFWSHHLDCSLISSHF